MRLLLTRLFRPLSLLLLAGALGTLAGCLTPHSHTVRQAGGLVDFLYPKASRAPALAPTVTELRPPVRVGIAFVPGTGFGGGPSEQEKQRLLERVKAAFATQPYIGKIDIIPTSYLRAGGGFDNLDQVARMFDVEVVTLLSYDQVRFGDKNGLSVLYWTIVGAYAIHGDEYDVQTLLDAAVFDVKSRKLLFRAPGTSQVKGAASLAAFSEQARAAQSRGYAEAVERLIPQLQGELVQFQERVKSDPQFRVAHRNGTRAGGSFGWPLALGLAGLFLLPLLHRALGPVLGWQRPLGRLKRIRRHD